MKKFTLLIAAAFLLFAGCTDNITNYYYGTDTGAIAGRISPADPGTVISTAAGTYQAAVDDQGYFLFDQLPPGIYHIVVQPTNYSRREIDGVIVDPGQVERLGEITLSTYPYPIYRTYPAAGEDFVRIYSYITLYADETLDLDDLADGTTIHPPLLGAWREGSSKSGANYRFEFSGPDRLRVGATYQVTIDASVKTAAGVPLGSDLSFGFQTEPLTVSVDLPLPGASGGIPIRDFRPRIGFNEYVHPDSVARAVSFDPSVEGIWLMDQYRDPRNDGARYFRFFPTVPPLLSQTTYALVISDQVALDDGMSLPRPDTTLFTTEPYGVTAAYPANGYPSMSPGVPIRLTFNIEMDVASVEAAFELTEIGGNPVEGEFAWETNLRQMEFRPGEALNSGAAYKITLSTDARTAAGENLTTDFASYFTVR